nr:1515_t:CDS:1 [Entrophospora candida]
MANFNIISLVLVVLLPFIIEKLRNYSRSQESNIKNQQKKTSQDQFIYFLILSTFSTQIYYIFWSKPPNIFRETGLPLLGSSTSLIRTILLQNKSELSEVEELLLEKLKSIGNRMIYATYGEEALLECTYCKEPTDYLYYIFPTIGWSYVVVVFVLGLVTMLKRKSHWRVYGVIFLVGCGVVEFYTFSQADVKQNGNTEFLYCTMDLYRRLAFSFLFLAIILIDKTNERSTNEILKDVAKRQEAIIYRAKAVNLQRIAVLRDSNLRRIFVDHFKRLETKDNMLSMDPVYRNARARAISRFNLERLMNEADNYIDKIYRLNSSGSDLDLSW